MVDDVMLKHNPEKPITQGWVWDKKINIYGTIGLFLAIASWLWNIQLGQDVNTRAIIQNKAIHDLEIQYIKEGRNQADILAAERFATLKEQIGSLASNLEVQMNRYEDRMERISSQVSENKANGER